MALEKQASEQEAGHLTQLLHIAERKANELQDSLQHLQGQDYPSKLARAEAELTHHQQLIASLEKENDSLRQRYDEFGAQVEQYMQTQTQEKAAVVSKNDEQLKRLEEQMDEVKRQAQDAVRSKQQELARAVDQVKLRHEALGRVEQKNGALQERIGVLEGQLSEEKVRCAQHVGKLEKDLAQSRLALEREQEKLQGVQKSLSDTKVKYENTIKSMQDAVVSQSQQIDREKDLESRTRWQNEFVAKQEARIEAMKVKYDAVLETQQNELVRARQAAMDTATATAARLDHARTLQQEEEHKRVQLDRERKRKEDNEADRLRKTAQEKIERELKEREQRIMERERAVADREATSERRRKSEAAQRKSAKAAEASSAAVPDVVVLNVNTAEDDGDNSTESAHRVTKSGKAIKVVNKVTSSGPRANLKNSGEFITRSQHEAEVQAKEAQAALRAEERMKIVIREFEERKEAEIRAAMVNVRKGVQKLETSLEEAKADRKRADEQLLSERQAFVVLKHENEELREVKGSIVQRLEEANENIGRLRAVVKESQSKLQQFNEQHKAAVQAEEQTAAVMKGNQRKIEELHKQVDGLQVERASLKASLVASESERKELNSQVLSLEKKLQVQLEDFVAEKHSLDEQSVRERQNTSVQYDTELRRLQSELEDLRARGQSDSGKFTELEQTIHDLRAENEKLQSAIDAGKVEFARQRKDFADLSRMHKNLKESMVSTVDGERSQRISAETQALELVKELGQVKLQKEQTLRACRLQLQKLRREWEEVKRGAGTDIDQAVGQLRQAASVFGVNSQKHVDALLLERDNQWRQRVKADKQEWKRRLAEKNADMDALLSNARVTDQSKYDQLAQHLDLKSREVADVETRLADQVDLNASLQHTLDALKRDAEHAEQQRAALQGDLTKTQEALQQSQHETTAALSSVQKWMKISEALRAFVVSTAHEKKTAESSGTALDKFAGLLSDDKWSEGCDLRDLSKQLNSMESLLRESGQKAIAAAKEESLQPLVSELEAAKACLEQYWRPSMDNAPASDALLYQHLPWYVTVARAIKQMQTLHADQVEALRAEVAASKVTSQSTSASEMQLQEVNNVLRFEKETLLREMELLSQNLQKRKDQELLELRAQFEQRIEQLKLHAEREQMRLEQDHEVRRRMLADCPASLFN